MIETRGTWTDLVAGVGLQISEVFDQGQEEYTVGIGKVLTLSTGTGAERHFSGKTGAGRLVKFSEGDDIPGGSRHKLYTTTIAYTNYGKYLQVTKNQIEDRDFAEALDEMKDLSSGANFSQDESGMQLFNGGFATTRIVNGYEMNFYGDGVPTYSTVHPTPVPGGSTQSNASSTGIPFGHDAFEVAKLSLVRQQTDDGIPMALMGKPMVIVPPALEREVQEEANSELNPENSNNTINVFRGTFDMLSTVFLDASVGGSNTAWFVTIPGRDKQYHETRQSADLESDVDILSKTVTFTVDCRWADYVKDYRRKWGSKGDNAAYAS